MKVFLWISIIFLAVSCGTKKNWLKSKDASDEGEKKFIVEGMLTYSSSYCGGADPGDDVIQEYQRQKPCRAIIYVREGAENSQKSKIIDSVFTDADGKFQLQLKMGKYVLFTYNQKSEQIIEEILKTRGENISVDEACLKNWWKGGLFQIQVIDTNIEGLNHNFHQNCFVPFTIPCIAYDGPYPP